MIDWLKKVGKWIAGVMFLLGALWLGWQKVSATKTRDKRRRQANDIRRVQTDKAKADQEAKVLRDEADALDEKAKAIRKEIDAKIEKRRNRDDNANAARARRYNDFVERVRQSRTARSE